MEFGLRMGARNITTGGGFETGRTAPAPRGAAAVGVILFLGGVNYLGVRFGGIVQNIFTIAKLGGMAALFLAAFLVPSAGGSVQNLSTSVPALQKQGFELVVAIAAALQGAFWAYDGWVKTTFLVTTKPARARVAELEAEITDLKNDLATAHDAQHAAEEQLGKLDNHSVSATAPAEALQVALDRLRRENRAYEERFENYRSTLPLPWALLALLVTLVGGFAAGLWWLDALIRRRHGGFRVY